MSHGSHLNCVTTFLVFSIIVDRDCDNQGLFARPCKQAAPSVISRVTKRSGLTSWTPTHSLLPWCIQNLQQGILTLSLTGLTSQDRSQSDHKVGFPPGYRVSKKVSWPNEKLISHDLHSVMIETAAPCSSSGVSSSTPRLRDDRVIVTVINVAIISLIGVFAWAHP